MNSANEIRARYALQRDAFSLDVALDIPLQGITGIFGASGAGKTTLLRCIAGLERAAKGKLTIGGDVWQDETRSRAVHERPIGYVFQESRLFDHLSVRANVEYGARRRDGRSATSFSAVVSMLGLDALLDRRPRDLSGGEAQRVAIARALLAAPQIVLMDEPLASLDATRKHEILPFLDRLHASASVPIIYVSHNLEEICRLCDHLVVLDAGRVTADSDLQSVLVRSNVPQLAGSEAGSVIDGTIRQIDAGYALTEVAFSGGTFWLADCPGNPGEQVRLRIRASDVSLSRERAADSTIINMLDVKIEHIEASTDASQLLRLIAGDEQLLARITRRSCDELNLKVGDKLIAQIKSVAVRHPARA